MIYKYLILKILISLYIVLFINCKNDNSSYACIDPNIIKPDYSCIEIYHPVCGCDKKTYSNSCHAKFNGLNDWIEGECEWLKINKTTSVSYAFTYRLSDLEQFIWLIFF